MAKKKSSSIKKKDRKVHKVSFKKEPIWLSMNIIGRYEGIKYRFTYREFCDDEISDDVIKTVKFSWPGRIPEDKDYAEKGIKALFFKSLNDGNISFKVVKDEEDVQTSEAEEKAILGELPEDAL